MASQSALRPAILGSPFCAAAKGKLLGEVEATDEREAIEKAAEEFKHESRTPGGTLLPPMVDARVRNTLALLAAPKCVVDTTTGFGQGS